MIINGKNVNKIANYISSYGCRNFGALKPPQIHGINPKLINPANGKSFELPRFCSVEMRQARQMNRIAIQQTKNVIKHTYPKASAIDLKRLTSETIEDSFQRVAWINPKGGKLYNLLKQGETEDGKILVRILDHEGAFIKEAFITPKTIVIPDDFTDPTRVYGLTHGELVTLFAKRNNPFAKYVQIPIDKNAIANNEELKGVYDYLNKGGKVDYLSCSYTSNVYSNRKVNLSPQIAKMSAEKMQYDKLANSGARILCGGGNATKELTQVGELSNDILIWNRKAEGVGALNDATGKISDFSLSRNSSLTQHYEVGEFTPRITKHGLNITGTTGTDIEFPVKFLKDYSKNPLIGKPVDRVNRIKDYIDLRLKELQSKRVKLFSQRKPISEIIQEKAKIEAQERIYNQRRINLLNYIGELQNVNGKYEVPLEKITGTSFSTPIRTAKLALNDMLEGII